MARKIDFSYKNKRYILTFDEYNELDTVECNGEFLSTKNIVVRKIVNNIKTIERGMFPVSMKGAHFN